MVREPLLGDHDLKSNKLNKTSVVIKRSIRKKQQ